MLFLATIWQLSWHVLTGGGYGVSRSFPPPSVIPAKAGIQSCYDVWVPASARTTRQLIRHSYVPASSIEQHI